MLDHDIQSYELIARVFDGASEGLTRDDILDNVTLYWLTNTAVSSARLYWENRNGKGGFFDPRGVPLPTGVSAFRYEIYQAPESWARTAYPHLVFYKAHRQGHAFRRVGAAAAADAGHARHLPIGALIARRRSDAASFSAGSGTIFAGGAARLCRCYHGRQQGLNALRRR